MRPAANQPAKMFTLTNTLKINNIEGINVEKLKFKLIIDQAESFTRSYSKIMVDYLNPLMSEGI